MNRTVLLAAILSAGAVFVGPFAVGPSYGDGSLSGAEDFGLFSSDGDADRILDRLNGNGYGLYVILNRAAPLIGEKLSARIVANVEKGAGLGHSQEYTEMVYFGDRPIYNFDEFYRSFRPDMRVWGFIGYGMSPEQIRFAPWRFAAHRYGGFTWFSVWTWEYQLFDMPTLALTRPDGTTRFHLARTLVAPDGAAEFRLRMAFNDPCGSWTLTATDVLAGLGVQRRFDVR